MDGYRLTTSIETRSALSGTERSCKMRERPVELCRLSGYERARGWSMWSINCAVGESMEEVWDTMGRIGWSFFECFVYFWDSIKLEGAGLASPSLRKG